MPFDILRCGHGIPLNEFCGYCDGAGDSVVKPASSAANACASGQLPRTPSADDPTQVEGDRVDITAMNRADLEEEYTLSQWALSWALHKLGGSMTITRMDMEDWIKAGRIWYERPFDGSVRVEFKELE